MGKKHSFLIIFLLGFTIPISCIAAKKKSDPIPLYVDESGWQIIDAIPGCFFTQQYEQVLAMGGVVAEQVQKFFPPYILLIHDKGCSFFYSLVAEIPDNIVTYWAPDCELILTYTHGKDTLNAVSNSIFFVNEAGKKMFFLYESQSEFSVPNSSFKISSRQNKYFVFARFGFKKIPDKLIECAPKGIRSIERR